VRPRTAERFRDRTTAWFDDVDLLLSPVTGGPAAARAALARAVVPGQRHANARWAPWTAAWNLAGLPALTLPAGTQAGRAAAGSPVRRPPGAEGRLLWLAGELERQQPWRRYAPVFDPTASPASPLVRAS
jgi:amidase